MTDDLVKRLRDCANGIGDFKNDLGDFGLCNTAADRIEELEAKLAKAVGGLTKISNRPTEMIWGEDREVRKAMQDMEEIADTTLAEMKGETE